MGGRDGRRLTMKHEDYFWELLLFKAILSIDLSAQVAFLINSAATLLSAWLEIDNGVSEGLEALR